MTLNNGLSSTTWLIKEHYQQIATKKPIVPITALKFQTFICQKQRNIKKNYSYIHDVELRNCWNQIIIIVIISNNY